MGFPARMNTPNSILPHDGEALLFSQSPPFSDPLWFERLLNSLIWTPDTVIMFGKLREMRRKSAWYGDLEAHYSYGGIKRTPLPWTPELLQIKQYCEAIAETTFNSVLCNLYHDGNDGMGWHADNEKELGPEPIIASVSFGAERPFAFKHRITKQRVDIRLAHGSILIMKGECQQTWLHSLPKTVKVSQPRINLTFRNILM